LNYYKVSILSSPLEPLTYSSPLDIKNGDLVDVTLNNKIYAGVIISSCEAPEFKTLDILNITDFFYSTKQMALAKFISTYYICSLGDALGIMMAFSKNKKTDIFEISPDFDFKLKLSTKQTKALTFLKSHKVSLVFGDTGSGKTEIYIKYIQKNLSLGYETIFLMPEISLTPQMEKRLSAVFGDLVAVWHSKITKKKKENILQNILNGKIKIIAGARSALFLPFQNLGLIIVDEAHDDSYKSEKKPKYNAKDLAIYMASKSKKIKTILGTATPLLNDYIKQKYIRIRGGYFNSSKKIVFDTLNNGLSDKIKIEIANQLQKDKQIIIFIPTRANFKYQICNFCNETLKCPFCSVGLSLHIKRKVLKCHYCNYISAIQNICPSCKKGELQNYRIGTAEVTDILQKEFPLKVIKKFDRDEIKTDKQLKTVLNDFDKHKIDILVGTQMISKGHDYHNVSLTIILGIDSIFSMADYRAREKALSLTLQISGRGGRKELGQTIIQTKNSDFFKKYFIDYESFLKDEIKFRENLYPPSVKLVKLLFSGKNQNKIYQNMIKIIDLIKNNQNNNFELIGYGEDNLLKIASNYRYHILLRAKKSSELLKIISKIDNGTFQVDIDPLII